MGIADLFGESLLEDVEGILQRNEMTPSAAADEIQAINDRVQATLTALNEADRSLNFFKIGSEELSPGEFEIGVMIPRNAVKNDLAALGEEFVELREIILPFSELAGESRPDLRVRAISSSEFQVFLDSAPATAAILSTAIERVIAAYKNILEIRMLHSKLAEQHVSQKALDEVAKDVSDGMENATREITEETLSEASIQDAGRLNELRTEINKKLNEIAERIDCGYNIQVRAGELPEESEEDEGEQGLDSETQQATNTVLENQRSLEFIKVPGEPILRLEAQGDNRPDDSGSEAANETPDDPNS